MTSLPRSTPTGQRVDPRALLSFLDALESRPEVQMHSLMVLRGGHVVAEGWWAPYSAERVHLLYSLSKSFTSTAVAFARAEGLLDLDDTAVSHFPELDADVTHERSRAMRLRHLAAMASGHDRDVWHEAFGADPEEPVRGFLTIPPDREPGSLFAYNQPCTYTLAAIVQRRSGQRLSEYLRPRLLDPLGIADVGWQSWPAGREVGFTGLHARTEDVAKLGQLYLQHGRWGGRQLLPEGWVEEATTKHVDNPDEPNVDWRQGYGFQFWMHRHGYRGDGAFGQFCVVLPDHDTVVATTASTEEMQAVLDLMWEHLLPGLGVDVGDRADDELALAQRLAGLRIPALSGATEAPDGGTAHQFDVTSQGAGHHVHSVGARAVADGLELTLAEADDRLSFRVGAGDWEVSTPTDVRGDPVPVAASGGWVDGTLAVDVLFLESAHGLQVRAALEGGADVTWNHVPLGSGRLSTMHAPG